MMIIAVTAMYGQPKNKDDKNPPPPPGHMDRYMTLPGLTEEQRSQIHLLMVDNGKAILPLQNKIGELEAKLRTLVTAENADMDKINSTIDEISSVKASIAKLQESMNQKIRKMLNAEQRLVLDSRPPVMMPPPPPPHQK